MLKTIGHIIYIHQIDQYHILPGGRGAYSFQELLRGLIGEGG